MANYKKSTNTEADVVEPEQMSMDVAPATYEQELISALRAQNAQM